VSGAGGQQPSTPLGRSRVLWLAVVSAVMFAALTAAILGQDPAVQGIDDRVNGWVVANRATWSVSLARVVTWGGSTAFVLPALLVVGAISLPRGRAPRDRLGAGLLLAAVGGAGVYVGLAINAWVGRPRPPIEDWAGVAGGPSYPSGHTTTGTLLAVLCAWALRDRAAPRRAQVLLWSGAVVVAVAVGWSRVWLGVHWPSDVAGGTLYGVAWSAVCLSALTRGRARRLGAQRPPDAVSGQRHLRPGLPGGQVAGRGPNSPIARLRPR
jgi:undecaprenyl-diphosphatase